MYVHRKVGSTDPMRQEGYRRQMAAREDPLAALARECLDASGAGADRLSHPFGVDGFRDKDKTDDASGPAGKLRRLGNA